MANMITIMLIYQLNHHHIVLAARISLTLSRHSSLSFIALGRSSGQQPVSSHSCWMYVRAGRPAFARPCVGIHKSTSLMSSSLFLQQCPACLVRLILWYIYIYIYIYSKVVKFVTEVEGNQKAPFELLLQRGVGEDTTHFPGLLHFTLDTYLILLSFKQGSIKYHL